MTTDFKMDPDMKARWVAALRSGTYKQAAEQLHSPSIDSYCCLGVLNEIENLGYPSHYAWLCTQTKTTDILKTWTYSDWVVLPQEVQEKLSKMNDNSVSFADIADYIEENL